ncbi:M23 family metallopeptidase [Candidatus Cryosericum terrychapinii]|uniref:M23 family peptidase n=1 Tax=Candidatus Cryosericum terrychapinii TaxID=2290919 RepID=A0A398CTB3_9BACT|nr:M23 family metallopeptidase [Candidatus Cryosericum terrychapinii]RIE05812.1 M23 family peptidase [Candidatus Cryosericum terrychapinii]
MRTHKAAGWILLVIAVAAAVVVLVGFSRNRADQRQTVAYVQSPDIWQARQHLLWQEVDVACNAQVAQQERILQTAEAEEAADVAAVKAGDHEAMIRQSNREDQLIRSVIAGCDPAVASQLQPVAELAWPLTGPMKVTSPYGERMHPIIGEETFHRGVDLRAHYGSPILAPADGVVLYIGSKTTYGNMVVVLHGGGIATVYGHLWKFAVHPYERVKKGQLLGYTGDTGFSTGPHLHFEVRQDGEPTNPLEWLPPIETTEQGAVIQ